MYSSSPPLWVLMEIRRGLRRHRIAVVFLAGFAAFCGAFSLYVAIDQWLVGQAFWSAVNTGIAFYNSITFDRNMTSLWIMRRADDRLCALISEKEGEE